MLKTFYKFTVVRDPIERILSAYKDKAYEEFRGKAGSKVRIFYHLVKFRYKTVSWGLGMYYYI